MKEKTDLVLCSTNSDNEPQVEIIDKSTERPEGAFDCNFRMTPGNHIKLKALAKYAMMLDWVTNATGENELSIDGVVNEVLDEALSKRVKELAKKHGFADAHDFTESLDGCKDGEEVAHVIRESEQLAYERAHDEILKHIPSDDKQKDLPFDNAK